jgi:hypothetical protein
MHSTPSRSVCILTRKSTEIKLLLGRASQPRPADSPILALKAKPSFLGREWTWRDSNPHL